MHMCVCVCMCVCMCSYVYVCVSMSLSTHARVCMCVCVHCVCMCVCLHVWWGLRVHAHSTACVSGTSTQYTVDQPVWTSVERNERCSWDAVDYIKGC